MKKILNQRVKPGALNVLLNFTDDKNKFGCMYNCNFCKFKHISLRSVPSNDDLETALRYTAAPTVVLTGGGEPFYNFDQNKEELLRIIDKSIELYRDVHVISNDPQTILDNIESEVIQKISTFILSSQHNSEIVLQCLKELKKRGKKTAINKILNKDESTEELQKFIDFYQDFTDIIKIREDYMNPLSDKEFKSFKDRILSYSTKIAVTRSAPIAMLYAGVLTSTVELNNIMLNAQNNNYELFNNYFLN